MHRHYFGHKVPAWGKLGCELGVQAKEEMLPNNAIAAVVTRVRRRKKRGSNSSSSSSSSASEDKSRGSGGGLLGRIITKAEHFFG